MGIFGTYILSSSQYSGKSYSLSDSAGKAFLPDVRRLSVSRDKSRENMARNHPIWRSPRLAKWTIVAVSKKNHPLFCSYEAVAGCDTAGDAQKKSRFFRPEGFFRRGQPTAFFSVRFFSIFFESAPVVGCVLVKVLSRRQH